MKSAEPEQPKLVKKSMMYMIVYEHLHAGQVRKGNFFTYMVDNEKIDSPQAIKSIEAQIIKEGKVDVVIIDFKPLKMIDVQPLAKKENGN